MADFTIKKTTAIGRIKFETRSGEYDSTLTEIVDSFLSKDFKFDNHANQVAFNNYTRKSDEPDYCGCFYLRKDKTIVKIMWSDIK